MKRILLMLILALFVIACDESKTVGKESDVTIENTEEVNETIESADTFEAGAEEDSFQKNKEKIIKANNFYGYKGEIEIYISYYFSDYSSFGDSGKNNVGKTYEGYLESVLDEENQKIIFYENDYVKELILENKNNNNLIFYDKKRVYDSSQNSEDELMSLKDEYPIHKYPSSILEFLYYNSLTKESFPSYFIEEIILSSVIDSAFEYYDEYGYSSDDIFDITDDYRLLLYAVGDNYVEYEWKNNVPYKMEVSYGGAEVIAITFFDEKGWLRRE